MKKSKTVILFGVLLIFALALFLFEKFIVSKKPEEVVAEVLILAQKKKFERVEDHVAPETLALFSSPEDSYFLWKKITGNFTLKEIKIDSVKVEKDDTGVVRTVLVYENGTAELAVFKLKKKGRQWKIADSYLEENKAVYF